MIDVDLPEKEPCPNCKEKGVIHQKIGASVTIDSARLGIRKPDRTFQREIVGRMQKNIPGNNIGKSNFTKFDIPGRAG